MIWILYHDDQAERGDLRVLAKCEKQQEARYVVAAIEGAMRRLAPEVLVAPKGTRDKAVQIVGVDYTRYRKYMNSDTEEATAISEVNKIFDSAMAASRWIGCRSNEVAIALAKARAAGRREATVRGVTFGYVDDLPE